MVAMEFDGCGQGVKIRILLGCLHFVTKAPSAAKNKWHPSANFEATDSLVRLIVCRPLDRREKTPIASSFHATVLNELQALPQ